MMNEQSERFRKITMKVLSMQLNSIIVMDLIAYGGAALGIILAVWQFQAGELSLFGALLVILLAAEFFLPMRLLGSYFHIAMNGMAAADKLFALLDLPDAQTGSRAFPNDCTMVCKGLHFGYEADREILKGIDFSVHPGDFAALVGESGCGKSTLAAILMGRIRGFRGELTIGGISILDIGEEALAANITYVGHQSYLFRGTIRDTLKMGNAEATDTDFWRVLEQVKLADFLREQQGLDTQLEENGVNFSGGQRQRVGIAQALLGDPEILVLDEPTAGLDPEERIRFRGIISDLSQQKLVFAVDAYCIGSRSSRKRNHSAPDRCCPRNAKACFAAGAAERASLARYSSCCGRSGTHKAIYLQQCYAHRRKKCDPSAQQKRPSTRRSTNSTQYGGSVSILFR